MQAEWGYIYAGRVRVSAVNENGENQVDDLEVGDIWYFPKGIPHTTQGESGIIVMLGAISLIFKGLDDENEFLLAFDDGKSVQGDHCDGLLTFW